MRSIVNIFGCSPFVPLQMHMEKVAESVGKLPEILEAYRRQDSKAVADLAYILSRTEHEADLIKHDIRNSMPRGLFMPVDRTNLLRILNIQDSIANRAENIGVLLTFKQAGTFDEFETAFDAFVAKCLEAFKLTRDIIDQLDELLETGFGGTEAQTVQEMVDKVAFKEYESDIEQRELLRLLLANEDAITYGDFFLWTRIIQQVGGLADRSNNLAEAVRMTLDTK